MPLGAHCNDNVIAGNDASMAEQSDDLHTPPRGFNVMTTSPHPVLGLPKL